MLDSCIQCLLWGKDLCKDYRICVFIVMIQKFVCSNSWSTLVDDKILVTPHRFSSPSPRGVTRTELGKPLTYIYIGVEKERDGSFR